MEWLKEDSTFSWGGDTADQMLDRYAVLPSSSIAAKLLVTPFDVACRRLDGPPLQPQSHPDKKHAPKGRASSGLRKTTPVSPPVSSTTSQQPQMQPLRKLSDCFRRIPKEEGYAAMWLGTHVATLRFAVTQTFTLAMRQDLKALVEQTGHEGETRSAQWIAVNIGIGGLAGGAACFLLYPLLSIDVLIQQAYAKHGAAARADARFSRTYTKLVKSEGPAALYPGVGAAVTGAVIFRSASFGLYDFFADESYGLLPRIFIGWGSSVVGAAAAHPLYQAAKGAVVADEEQFATFRRVGRSLKVSGIVRLMRGGTRLTWRCFPLGLLLAVSDTPLFT